MPAAAESWTDRADGSLRDHLRKRLDQTIAMGEESTSGPGEPRPGDRFRVALGDSQVTKVWQAFAHAAEAIKVSTILKSRAS
jgi:hypothetical protein